ADVKEVLADIDAGGTCAHGLSCPIYGLSAEAAARATVRINQPSDRAPAGLALLKKQGSNGLRPLVRTLQRGKRLHTGVHFSVRAVDEWAPAFAGEGNTTKEARLLRRRWFFLDRVEGVLVFRVERLQRRAFALDLDHRLVLGTVADHGHRLEPLLDLRAFLEQHLVIERDAAVARREMLAGAIGDRALADPGDAILQRNGVADQLAIVVEHALLRDLDRQRRRTGLALRSAVHDLQGMRVVDRHADLEARRLGRALRENLWEEHGMADRPVVGGLRLAFEQATLVEAVFERIESDLHMPRRIHRRRTARFLFLIIAELRVQEFEMHGIGRVVHALHPVAGQRIDLDRAIEIVAHEQIPARQQWHRRRTHIGPDEAAERLAGIGLDLDLFFVAQLGMREIFEGHLDAIALRIEHPAVIGAAQAAILGNAVFQRHAAMRAAVV